MSIPRINLHTHTRRCKHAAGSVADYCVEAEKAGISILGFSDHSPFPDAEYADSRMDFSELPEYRREIDEAREKFPGLIILAGLEIDYRPVLGSAFYQEEYLEKLGLDYLIAGVHFLPAENGIPARYLGFEKPFSAETVRKFVKETVRVMETGLIDYLAHPDITAISCECWTPDLKAAYKDILEASLALDIPLEVNAYGLRKNPVKTPAGGMRPPYPWLPFWELAAEYGVKTVAGSDAHRPCDVWGNIEDAAAIASRFHLVNCNQEIAEKIILRTRQSGRNRMPS